MRHLRERPPNCRINKGNSFYTGLLFASLGQNVGSVVCEDSSQYRRNAVLCDDEDTPSGFYDGSYWSYISELGRFGFTNANNDTYNKRRFVGGTVLSSITELTIAIWVKNLNVGSALINAAPISCRDPGSNTNPGAGIAYGSSNLRFTPNNGYINIIDNGNSRWYDWNHLVGTYSPNRTNKSITYLNGVQANVNTSTRTVASESGNLYLCSGLTYFWYCVFCDVLIYNRALSEIEISQLADPSNPMLSNLLLPPKRKYYPVLSRFKPSIFKSKIFVSPLFS